jgi:hypothetical protein
MVRSPAPDGGRVHPLSACDTARGMVLAQVQIAAKSNESPRAGHVAMA